MILVLSEGQVVERGPHESLLAMNGLYKQMWERQSKGFVDGEMDGTTADKSDSPDILSMPHSQPAE